MATSAPVVQIVLIALSAVAERLLFVCSSPNESGLRPREGGRGNESKWLSLRIFARGRCRMGWEEGRNGLIAYRYESVAFIDMEPDSDDDADLD